MFAFDHPGEEPTGPGRAPCSPVLALYNDMTEKQKHEAYDLLVPIYADTFTTPAPYSGWQDVPLTYVICEKDQAIFPEVQRDLLQRTGVAAEVRTLSTSHTPFISAPKEIAALVEEAAGI